MPKAIFAPVAACRTPHDGALSAWGQSAPFSLPKGLGRRMLGPSGARLEHLRWWVVGSVVGIGVLAGLLGPTGLLLIPYLLGIIFAYGYELCRPLVRHYERDQFFSAIVRLSIVAFVPLLFVAWYIDTIALSTTTGGPWRTEAWIFYPTIGYLLSTAVVAVGSFCVLRRRATPHAMRLHLYSLILVAIGTAWLFVPSGLFWYLSALLIYAPLVAWLGHAFWRVVRPVERAPVPLAPTTALPTTAPTFTPFGGR